MLELSVVIPCYNAGHYIKQMLDCCIKQTYKNWEVIVVDDGSTDGETLEILKEMSVQDARIQFVERNRQPKGGDTCRNIGMENAKGKYLIIFDADDLISDDCFENRVRYMDENEDCDFASFPGTLFFNGKPIPQKWNDSVLKFGVKKGNKDNLYYLLSYNYPYAVWNNIYRRKSIEDVKWDERILVMQDFDWMVSCELKGLKHKYSNSKQFDYYYRQFSDGHSVSGSFMGQPKCQSTYYLFDKTLARLKERPDYEERKQQLLYYVTVHLNRLLVGGAYYEAGEFIILCEKYYPRPIIRRLNRMAVKYKKKSEIGDVSPLRLFYYSYTIYGIPKYIVPLAKNFVKKLLGQKQVIHY